MGTRQFACEWRALALLSAHHSAPPARRAPRRRAIIFNVGIEPEFMLLKKNARGEYVPWDPLDNDGQTLLRSARPLPQSRRDDHLLSATCRNWAGIPTPAITKTPIASLKSIGSIPTPDHRRPPHVLQVDGAHGGRAAWRCGRPSCPNRFSHLTGNGAHFHLSLADAEDGGTSFWMKARNLVWS